jgi:hypothetical protein
MPPSFDRRLGEDEMRSLVPREETKRFRSRPARALRSSLALTLGALILGLGIVGAPTVASAEAELGEKVYDAMVLRPVGFLRTVGGFALFVVSVPLLAIEGDYASSWDYLVVTPADDAFKRELGQI